MNKKVIVILTTVLVATVSIYLVYSFFEKENNIQEIENQKYISKQIEDECTEEYKESQNIITVSMEQEKVSANAILILKKYYINCDHTVNEYVELPQELVNMTENEIIKNYPEWDVIGFSSDKITLYKEFSDTCGEHFKLRLEDGYLVIYLINNDGTESIYEKTNISSEYFTDTDLINMQNGLDVYGKEELNKIIEDFE